MFFKRFKNLREFRPYYKRYIKNLIFLLIVMLIASSAGMILSWLMSEQLVAITDLITGRIIKYTILIIIGVTIHHICWYLWSMLHSRIANKIALDIKTDVFNSFLHTKYNHIKNKTSGYYLERLSDDIETVSNFLGDVMGTMVDVLTNCSFLVIIYFLNWQCGLFLTIGIILLFTIDSIRIKIEVKNTKQIKITSEESSSKFIESLKGIKEIKGLGIEDEVAKKYKNINTKLHNRQHQKTVVNELLMRLKTFCQYLIDAGLVFICAFWLFPTEQVSVVILLIIFNYKGLLYDTIGFFSRIKSEFCQGEYRAERILELIYSEKETAGKLKKKIVNSSIKIMDLSYSYNDQRLILKDINFDINANSCSCFVGESGNGKTTLFNILTRLLQVEDGKVFYGGIDINKFDLDTLRKTICIVGQEPFLFNDTIINNLRLANKNASLRKIEQICKIANIHNEIIAMQDGYNTCILENGANLSGGQKQRLSIARALLKNAPIILFDEPTSALDKSNQEMFFKTLKKLKKSKTICIIAHKLESYELFDNVFKL